jgi:hypothetical protein
VVEKKRSCSCSMAEQAVLYVNGRRRRLPGDRAQQTLLSYLRGARAPTPALFVAFGVCGAPPASS